LREVAIGTDYITLGQLLKLVDCVGSGGEVKAFLQEKTVTVNGVPDNRRGRKLVPGDTVEVESFGTIAVKAR
jgi:ribosome-associated protein